MLETAFNSDTRSFQSAFHRGIGCYSIPGPNLCGSRNFQSAFHRGIGCYTTSYSRREGPEKDFQSAFHRGIGCYTLEGTRRKSQTRLFQSAFHRGIGCYFPHLTGSVIGVYFQSAFHRGIGCYFVIILQSECYGELSVRFSSRHRLLPRKSIR